MDGKRKVTVAFSSSVMIEGTSAKLGWEVSKGTRNVSRAGLPGTRNVSRVGLQGTRNVSKAGLQGTRKGCPYYITRASRQYQ